MSEEKEKKPVRLYTLLNIAEFNVALSEKKTDPGRDDVRFILEVARSIPRSQDEMLSMDAGYLATTCLAGLQRASELFSKAILWQGVKKGALDYAMAHEMSKSTLPVTVRKDMVKEKDEYQKAFSEYHVATAYVEFYSGIKGTLEKGHYWAKGKEAHDETERRSAGYEPHDHVTSSKKGPIEQVDLNV